MRRFSSTLSRGNSRRLSGTCAMPGATTSCAGVARSDAPSKVMRRAVGWQELGDDAQQRGLAGAVGADHATASPALHLQRDAEQRLEAAVAGVDAGELEQRRSVRSVPR